MLKAAVPLCAHFTTHNVALSNAMLGVFKVKRAKIMATLMIALLVSANIFISASASPNTTNGWGFILPPDVRISGMLRELLLPEPANYELTEITHISALAGTPELHNLELPIFGATGWTAARTQLMEQCGRVRIKQLEAGQAFTILAENGEWWSVRLPCGVEGWVRHNVCFINLPDVIPSIVFNNTNATESIFMSYDYDIPGITGYQLYSARTMNYRFEREMYIVPALYATALMLHDSQQAALADARTLVVYEVFRPRDTQRRVVAGLQALMSENRTVRSGINTYPWSAGWFIAHGISVHQRGAAIDASLARVIAYEVRTMPGSGVQYRKITQIEYYEMPSQMHDLHPRAASLAHPNRTALAPGITEGAIFLRNYFIDAGFTPIASEWWHFSDARGNQTARSHGMSGEFFTATIYSAPLPPNPIYWPPHFWAKFAMWQ